VECFPQAARRLFEDGELLRNNQRFATACHLYGLAAECALKACMKGVPGNSRQLPYRHLPEIANDARRWLTSKRHKGLLQLLGNVEYMRGWDVQNRYWSIDYFTEGDCVRFRDHARRTLYAALPGVA
jgi:hypothetical protein